MAADLLDLLERFVAVPSPTGEEGPFADLLARTLADEGLRVERLEVAPGRPNLLARPGGAEPRVYFATHIDVVPPHIPPRREGTRLHGRGAADTKGPLVAMIAAARRLRGEGVPVGFLLVVGEEVDHSGAIHAARTLDLGRPRIVLAEPTSNRAVSAQKGLLKVRLSARGVAGHSAFPDRGVSAVHRLLAVLTGIALEPWPTDPLFGPTTWNVGRIAGGVAANVFAPTAWADVLFRLACTTDEAVARLTRLCAASEGVSFEVQTRTDPLRLDVPEGVPTCVIPFNSDASYLAPLGPLWLCGPGAIELAHSEREHIDLADLEAGIETYVRLARSA